VDGFSNEQRQAILQALQDLNTSAGRTIIRIEEGRQENYPVSFHLAAPTPETENRAGEATVASDSCSIEISSRVFDPTYVSTLQAVVWHELGHCAGLLHVPDPGEIMYRITNGFSTYQAAALDRFYRAILGSAQL
jgi:hypothetical protein